VLLTGSRSILGRPTGEKRMLSPSTTDRAEDTYGLLPVFRETFTSSRKPALSATTAASRPGHLIATRYAMDRGNWTAAASTGHRDILTIASDTSLAPATCTGDRQQVGAVVRCATWRPASGGERPTCTCRRLLTLHILQGQKSLSFGCAYAALCFFRSRCGYTLVLGAASARPA